MSVTPTTIADLARRSGLSINTLHQRRIARGVAGRSIGRTLVFTAAEQRRLLAEVPRGRPRKKRKHPQMDTDQHG